MNKHFLTTTLIASSMLFITGCSDDSPFDPNASSSNSGLISQNNFSLLTADVAPGVIDATTGVFSKTDVELTVYIGDRNNQTLTDSHTINFKTEYGLVEPSCVTEDGSCSVTWSAIARPDFIGGGPGSDGFVTITAYTIGEEGFTDANGNNVFDDGDGTNFDDIEEPFIDADESFAFSAGDGIIDVVSTNDPTGQNQVHDIADGFFNGPGCTHSSLCGTATSITIFDAVTMSLVSGIASRTIGGTVSGLATGASLVLQNNGGDDLTIVVDGNYTFATPVEDGLTYTVAVLTQPTVPSQTCGVANASGNVSANVTNVDVTCVTNAFSIGGTVTGIPAGETITLQNNNDGIDLVVNGGAGAIPYTFVDLVQDLGAYSVSIESNSAGLTCDFIVLNSESGNVAGANVDTIDIGCI